MKCPVDGTDLVMTERMGVEIDYCPKCRGIWLDRGELDKLIEKSLMEEGGVVQGQVVSEYDYPSSRHDDEHHGSGGYYRGGRRRHRGGWLGEIFDF